jgi:hypothetical protein
MNAVAPQKPVGTPGYAVSRAQSKCHGCAREIGPGEKLMAGLRETPALLERLDICPACWEKFDRAGLIGFWQTTMPQPTAKKPMFIDDQVLCELFERLGDATEPAKVNFRFVLGLILMRKRYLVYESTRTEGGKDIWSVRFKGREDKLDLLDPRLSEQQVGEVSTQLGEILNGDL